MPQQVFVHQWQSLRNAGLAGRSGWVWRGTMGVVGILMAPFVFLAALGLVVAGIVGLGVFWVLSAIDRLFGGPGQASESVDDSPSDPDRVNVRVIDPHN
jgi:hypothetical protein